MEDLKHSMRLPKFVAACNGHPNLVKVTVKHDNPTQEDAVEQAKVVDRFIKMKVAEKEERLNRFRKEVSQRVKERETHKQALIGKHVRKVARKEARMVCQAQSEVGKSLETRSGLLQTDVDDVCLVTKKISPKSNQMRQWARDQLLAQRRDDIDMSELPGGWWGLNDPLQDKGLHKSTEAGQVVENGRPVNHQYQYTGSSQQQQQQVCQESPSVLSPVPSTVSASTAGCSSTSDLSTTTCCESVNSSTSLCPHGSCLKGSDTSLNGPLISSCTRNLQRKNDRIQQYVTCRKVYAAVGREKVRKSRQHTEHKRAAVWLKKVKEQERMDLGGEVESDTSTESFTSSQVEVEEERVRQWQQAMLAHEEKRRAQKYKETERYIEALKERIKERMKNRGIDPPPLCACHSDMWSSGPLTCANNCMFYKNPAVYAQALSSLLASLDVL